MLGLPPPSELHENEGLTDGLPRSVKALPKLNYVHLDSSGLKITGKLAEDAKALKACWQSIGGEANELLNEAEDNVTKWKGVTVEEGRVTKLGKPRSAGEHSMNKVKSNFYSLFFCPEQSGVQMKHSTAKSHRTLDSLTLSKSYICMGIHSQGPL